MADNTESSLTGNDIQVLTALVGRYMSLRGGSQTSFQGDRDYNTILGYPVEITFEEYAVKFRRQDVARAVISAKPDATWRKPPKLTFSAESSSSEQVQGEFLAAWGEMVRRVRLYDTLRRADVRSGLGQYSAVVLGFSGRGDWPTDIGKKKAVGDLAYLRVFDQPDALIDKLEGDREKERYNLPLTYKVKVGQSTDVITHWTRVLHVTDDPETDDVYGTPRMEVVYNLLEALMKIVHGGAEAVWSGMVGTYHASVKEDYELDPTARAELSDSIQAFLHGLTRVVQTEGIDLDKMDPQITDTKSAYEVCIELISAATRIPKSILVGSDRGDVSKAEEAKQWAGVIRERRESFANRLLRDLMERLVNCGSLPQIETDEINFEWQPLYELSETELATIAKARGEAISAVSSGSSADVYVSPTEFRSWLGLEPRPDNERDFEMLGLLALMAKIVASLTSAGATLYPAALTAGFSPEQAAGLVAFAATPVQQ